MTLAEALSHAGKLLSGIEDAGLESEVLLRHLLSISRTELCLSLHDKLSPEQEKEFRCLVDRRLSGEPAAYIVKNREFYGLDFYVDSRVLIPRPDTEILVEKAIEHARNRRKCTIADIGTGSGAIAIALAANLPQVKIYASDISAPALAVARYNCRRHGVTGQIELIHGDLLDVLPEAVDLIVANLPYVREPEVPQVSEGFEPELALNGGAEGLDKLFQICRQAPEKLHPDGCLMLEIGLGQKDAVTSLLYELFPSAVIEVIPDLRGIDRVVSLSLAPVTAAVPSNGLLIKYWAVR